MSILYHIAVFVENIDYGVLGTNVFFATEFSLPLKVMTTIKASSSKVGNYNNLHVIIGKSQMITLKMFGECTYKNIENFRKTVF